MTPLSHAPLFSSAGATAIARQHFGWDASVSPLPSERDQNFLLVKDDGEHAVLKIANSADAPTLLALQNHILERLHRSGVDCCQRVLPSLNGNSIESVSDGERDYGVRLLSYRPGRPLAAVHNHPPDLLHALGHMLGRVDSVLEKVDDPALHRTFPWDLSTGLQTVAAHQEQIADDEMRTLVSELAAAFARHTQPFLADLPRQTIHNDVNDYNVLVDLDDSPAPTLHITGLLDWGDMLYSIRAADLAVACAYISLSSPNPLSATAHLVAGFHKANPLTEAEVAALFDLIRLRLCISVCMAAVQMAQRPDDAYLAVSQEPIRRALPRLANIHPRFARAVYRHACGLQPLPHSTRLVSWLQQRAFAPLVDGDLARAHELDLSVGSSLVAGDPDRNCEEELTPRIWEAMDTAPAAVGRYNEARLIYTEPAFATGPHPLDERRTIHLGLDLFQPAGATVYAPLAGTVHGMADNRAPQDFGPTLVLRHQTDNGDTFFTLYGHLSRDSLQPLSLGATVDRGQPIATIGAATENGGWPPHLHFQIITDLLDQNTSFPGVGVASQRHAWTAFCPDPNLIVGTRSQRTTPALPSPDETLRRRRTRLGGNLSIGYRDPVKITRGWMQYLFDQTGRRYLDAYNNVPHVGHCHPRVTQALHQQASVLNTNTRYLHDNLVDYADALVATLPEPLQVCYFLNSASEANELALRMVRAATGSCQMIVLEGAYHGNTSGLIDISPYKHSGPGGQGAPDWVHAALLADGYRGPHKSTEASVGLRYAAYVAEIIADLTDRGKRLGGFIAESRPSVGGQITFPPGYLATVYKHVRAAGGLCIADEVQTGYGRIGTHFYAFQEQDVVPDIVVLGKPIGNGHPVAALVTTPTIAAAFDNGMEFFSTFGGNTVSCAVGRAVLDVVSDERLQQHALRVGNHLLNGLRPLSRRFALVGDVRGSGLFLGVELVRNRETLTPAAPEAAYIANRMRQHGILLGTDGPLHNVIKIRPPMPFTTEDAELLVDRFVSVLEEIS